MKPVFCWFPGHQVIWSSFIFLHLAVVVNTQSAFTYHWDKHFTWISSFSSHYSLMKNTLYCANYTYSDTVAQRVYLTRISQPVSGDEMWRPGSPEAVFCSSPPGGFSYKRRCRRTVLNAWSTVMLGVSWQINKLAFPLSSSPAQSPWVQLLKPYQHGVHRPN